MQGKELSPESSSSPLVLDLDGTLVKTDVFFEACFKLAREHFALVFVALLSLLKGRAQMKEFIAHRVRLDTATLSFNQPLLDYARRQADLGRPVFLVTASHQIYADQIGEQLGFFSRVHGSTVSNLKGRAKAAFLREHFPDGYVYAGDSPADLPVWAGAQAGIFAGRAGSGRRAFTKSNVDCEVEFVQESSTRGDWLRALRLHQWAKNLLVFAAVFLGHVYTDPYVWLNAVCGFVSLGLVASATYVVNDLLDLDADRRHPRKRNRPFASGRLKVSSGIVAILLTGFAGLAIALFLPFGFQALLVSYIATTLAYSFYLKRLALLDVFVLGSLFTVRIAMGTTLASVLLSPWLLVFSMFFFTGLSMAKRHAELGRAKVSADSYLPGRGYKPSDAPLVMAIGVACASSAVLILTLYLMEGAFPSGAYNNPAWLWAVPVLTALWLCRVWLLAWRKELHDDPVVFAIKDSGSRAMGIVLAFAFLCASVG